MDCTGTSQMNISKICGSWQIIVFSPPKMRSAGDPPISASPKPLRGMRTVAIIMDDYANFGHDTFSKVVRQRS